jgi:hypothetical protein
MFTTNGIGMGGDNIMKKAFWYEADSKKHQQKKRSKISYDRFFFQINAAKT